MDLLTLMLARNGAGEGGGGSVTVDSALSGASENPVQNKAVKAALDGKSDTGHTHDTRYYTQAQTDAGIESAISEAFSGISQFEYYLCGAGEYDTTTGEPTVQNPDTSHIYLTPTSGDNLYMYAYINSSFVFLGTTEIDLSGYVTAADLADYVDATALATALADKSDVGHTHDTRYYTETEIDTALAGKSNTGHTHAWSEITGKPSNIVTGSAKAYSIVVSSSAPASGTADSVITIVIPS